MPKWPPLLQPDELIIRAGVGVRSTGHQGAESMLPVPPSIGPFGARQGEVSRCYLWRPHKGDDQERHRLTRRRPSAARGHFRLLHRLMTQITRIMEINALRTVTCQVVEAARERLVIGTA
jgi:hypothetical protein